MSRNCLIGLLICIYIVEHTERTSDFEFLLCTTYCLELFTVYSLSQNFIRCIELHESRTMLLLCSAEKRVTLSLLVSTTSDALCANLKSFHSVDWRNFAILYTRTFILADIHTYYFRMRCQRRSCTEYLLYITHTMILN